MNGLPADGINAGNRRVKRLRRLITQRKARSAERAFVVEGPGLIAEALAVAAAGALTIEELLVDRHATDNPWWPDLDAAAAALGVTAVPTAPGVLATVLDAVTPRPVAAIVSRPPATVDALPSSGPVACVVEASDPGNVGTLIRSAEAAGAAGLVLAGPSVDPTNPKVVRSSAGSGLRLPVAIEPDVERALDALAATGRPLVATVATPDARPYDEVDLTDAVILLGNETRGLPDDVVDRADVVATVPFAGPTESLNLAVAGSLFCFEALRQRRVAAARHQVGDDRGAGPAGEAGGDR